MTVFGSQTLCSFHVTELPCATNRQFQQVIKILSLDRLFAAARERFVRRDQDGDGDLQKARKEGPGHNGKIYKQGSSDTDGYSAIQV
jgi:hypothetical protein